MLRPLIRPIVRPLVRGVTEPGYGSLNAFSAVKKAIRDDAADVNILVIGDSTGDNTNEWPYLLADWLSEQCPTHSVEYRLWNDATPAYGSAVSLATGSGAHKITLWNASIGGTRPQYLLAAKMADAVVAPNPSVVIFNHGHNMATTDAPNIPAVGDNIAAAIETVQLALPDAAIAFISQNPARDTDLYAPKDTAYRAIAPLKPRSTFVDVYSEFIAQNKDAALYNDNVHPSPAGTAIFLSAVQRKWRAASPSPVAAEEPWLASTGTNLLVNGDFASFASSVPFSWGLQFPADSSTTKELTIVDGASPYSVKLTQDSGTAACAMTQTLAAGALTLAKAAGSVSVAVRRYIPSGGAATRGRFALLVTSPTLGTVVRYTFYPDEIQDVFGWAFIRNMTVPADATVVRLYLYVDTASAVGASVYFDRAIMVTGSVPRDMA